MLAGTAEAEILSGLLRQLSHWFRVRCGVAWNSSYSQ